MLTKSRPHHYHEPLESSQLCRKTVNAVDGATKRPIASGKEHIARLHITDLSGNHVGRFSKKTLGNPRFFVRHGTSEIDGNSLLPQE